MFSVVKEPKKKNVKITSPMHRLHRKCYKRGLCNRLGTELWPLSRWKTTKFYHKNIVIHPNISNLINGFFFLVFYRLLSIYICRDNSPVGLQYCPVACILCYYCHAVQYLNRTPLNICRRLAVKWALETLELISRRAANNNLSTGP